MKKLMLREKYLSGFFKREVDPQKKETLISRLIDRPLRPLFASTYNQEVSNHTHTSLTESRS